MTRLELGQLQEEQKLSGWLERYIQTEGFIRAETIAYDRLIECGGSLSKAVVKSN